MCVKFIFLDVDGVLNADLTTTQRTKNGYVFVEEQFLERLKTIVNATNAHIILSSDWRFDAPSGSDYIELFNALAEFDLEIASMTYEADYNNGRGAEIQKWLDFNVPNDIEYNYVILDDLPQFEFIGKEDHLVRTNSLYGLQDEDVIKAIKILNGDINAD